MNGIPQWLMDGFDLELVSVKGFHVIVTCKPGRSVGVEGHDMMAAESCIRLFIGKPYEIYLEQRKDENKPRGPELRERVAAWMKARDTFKTQGS